MSLTTLVFGLLLLSLPSASASATGATSTAAGSHPQHHPALSALSSWTGMLNAFAAANILVLLLLLRSALKPTRAGYGTPLSAATLVATSFFAAWASSPVAFATTAAAFTQWQHLDPSHVALPVLVITTASSASIALWFRALSGRLSGAGYPPPPDAHDVFFLAWAMEFFQSPAMTASQRPTPSEALESGALNFFSRFLQGNVNPVGSLTADHAWGVSRRLAAASRALLVARRLQERFHQTLADVAALLPAGRQPVNFFDLPACLQPTLDEFVQLKKDLLATTSAITTTAALASISEPWNHPSILAVFTSAGFRVPSSLSDLTQALNQQFRAFGDLAHDVKRLTGTTKTSEVVNDLTTLTSAGWTFQQLLALLPSLHKAWEALTARFPGSPSVTLAGLTNLLAAGISPCDHPSRLALSLGLPADTPFETSLLAVERLRQSITSPGPASGPQQKQIEVAKFAGSTDKTPYHDWVAALERKFLVDYNAFSSPRGIAAYIMGLLSDTAARVATTFPLHEFAETFVGPRSSASAVSIVSAVVALLDPEFKDHNLLSNSDFLSGFHPPRLPRRILLRSPGDPRPLLGPHPRAPP
ncbi:hypothetical protein BDD12DRAFT_808453 [Trichophaea hybrida]|nr:hypothetical protein BDD12DRAFT_808453 [Trichophaea hybrida]